MIYNLPSSIPPSFNSSLVLKLIKSITPFNLLHHPPAITLQGVREGNIFSYVAETDVAIKVSFHVEIGADVN